MKKLIYILALLFTLSSFSQVTLGVYQDPKLALFKDDYGNKPFTLDMKISVEWRGNQFKYHYFSIRPEFEYAELEGGKYVAWLVNGGWVFNELIVEDATVAGYITTGVIHRWGRGYPTYGVTGDISYGKRLKVSLLGQILRSTDLIERWQNKDKTFRYSVYVGIKYEL